MSGPGLLIQGVTGGADRNILSGVALCRAHIMDAAVGMVMVIPNGRYIEIQSYLKQIGSMLDTGIDPG